jgi:hypothetical protein
MMGIRRRLLDRVKANANAIQRRRRLALLIVVLMLPIIFASTQVPGVYYSRADVLFLPPAALVGGNLLQADPAQTLHFAAIVEHRINAEQPSYAPRTTSAPLYGTGVRNTHAVYIPSSGGQWQLSFNRPVITVEVVADSSEKAAQELAALVERVSELAAASQDSEGIPATAQITTELSPGAPFVTYVDVRSSRAAVSLLLLTVGLAGGIPLLAERLKAVRQDAGDPASTQ